MVGIDNHASTTISNIASLFFWAIIPVKGGNGEGFFRSGSSEGLGDNFCKIEDDEGIVHPIKIKKAFHVTEYPSCLIEPQKWAQQTNNNYPKPYGTWCATKARHYILYWKHERCQHTIPWDPTINVPRILSAPSSNTYRVFLASNEQYQKR